MSASVLSIPSIMPFRGYMIPKLYHVTVVTVHRLDGMEARMMTCYNEIALTVVWLSIDTISYSLV
jgi:hypothetical protein